MFALPHFSVRIAVGVASSCLAVVAWACARSMRGFPDRPRLWIPRLVVRAIADVRRRDRVAFAWVGVALWSVTVSALHFAGLAFEIYAAVSWWDLLTHSMSGSGVAALALLTHRGRVATGVVWWVVPTVIAIGAGFEVYEFVVKSFWHDWTVRQYAVDTAVDLVMNALGAALSASVAERYETMTDESRSALSTPERAD